MWLPNVWSRKNGDHQTPSEIVAFDLVGGRAAWAWESIIYEELSSPKENSIEKISLGIIADAAAVPL